MTKIVNLLGGPGTGKSTTAAGLFHLMKVRGYNVEMALEYAKEVVWAKNFNTFDNQIYIFAKQHNRLHRIYDQVDYVITDAPLLFSLVYAREDMTPEFEALIIAENAKYDDQLYVFLNRVKPFNPAGRVQTEESANELDVVMKQVLIDNNIEFLELDADEDAHKILYRIIKHDKSS